MRVVTIATAPMLPQARALERSLSRHAPEWPLDIIEMTGDGRLRLAEVGPARSSLPSLAPAVDLDLGIDVTRLLEWRGALDATLLLLPRVLGAYCRQDLGPVLHLPPTAWVVGGLDPIAAAMSKRSVMLAPRMLTDLPDDELEPSGEQMELAGRISEMVVAVDGSADAQGFLRWWSVRLEAILGSIDGRLRAARPEDRPWLARTLELAPARFATAVLDDPGCNVSMWNLHERPLEWGREGALAGGHRLRFLDLPGFDPRRPHRLNRDASRARPSRSPVLRALCAEYAAELDELGWSQIDRREDVGRRLVGGVIYDDVLRELHVLALELGEPFADPFDEAGSRAFMAWLRAPASDGGAHGLNRYLVHRISRERPDVLRAYPDLNGPDGAECVRWFRAFGREELDIPDCFMPGAAADGDAAAAGRGDGGDDTGAGGPDVAEPGGDGPGRERDTGLSAAASGSARAGAQEGSVPSVRVTGYLGHALGLGAAARAYARALSAAAVPVSTASVAQYHLQMPRELDAGYGLHGFEDLECGRPSQDVELVAVNPDELPGFIDRVGRDYLQGARIGVWAWETDTIPRSWRRAFEFVDEIWVNSSFMAQNIAPAAPVPVVALPPPVEPPPAPPTAHRLGLPDDDFLFLFMFDYLSTVQRKNPVGLIEAFKRAFSAGEGPRLLLKTINAPLRPMDEEHVLWAADGRPDIHVIDRSLTGEQRDGLIEGCDCYVSLHRSEGFGLTLAEAMAVGKPVIATGYSGNLEFMDGQNSYLVDYELARVGAECEIYPPEGEWAEPSVEHAAELMRRVCRAPADAMRIGERARADIASNLSARATGLAMRTRLEERVGRAA